MTGIASAGAIRAGADQLDIARQISTEMLEAVRAGGPGVVEGVLGAIPALDMSAFLIAVANAARTPNPAVALADLLAALSDTTWAETCADALSAADRIGVGSMGATTRAVLEAVAARDRSVPQIVVPDVAVARGIGYLQIPIYTGDITAGDTLLVSGVALHESTVWTSSRLADACTRGRVRGITLFPAVHPVAELTMAGRRRYRPFPGIEAVEID
jgi:hypothetical protein